MDASTVSIAPCSFLVRPFLTSSNLVTCWPLIAFGLFRLFDIAKPGPVAWAEHVPGVAGVMLDDIVAGALVVILMHGLLLPLVI